MDAGIGYGQYEPAAIAELVETVEAERGVRFDLTLLKRAILASSSMKRTTPARVLPRPTRASCCAKR